MYFQILSRIFRHKHCQNGNRGKERRLSEPLRWEKLSYIGSNFFWEGRKLTLYLTSVQRNTEKKMFRGVWAI